jgi:hypothetical protein
MTVVFIRGSMAVTIQIVTLYMCMVGAIFSYFLDEDASL